MHKPPPNRRRTSHFAISLLLAAITTLAGCNACNPKKVTAVPANLIVSGSIGDCHYQAGIGQQSVYIDIKGTSTNNSSYTWTQTFASVPSSTYSVQAPDQGLFTVTVIVTETAGNKLCQPCVAICAPNTPNPRWKGSNSFTGTTAANNTLNVTVELPASPTKDDCGC